MVTRMLLHTFAITYIRSFMPRTIRIFRTTAKTISRPSPCLLYTSWELAADREEAEALNRRYAVSSLKNQGDKTALRIISEDCPAPEAVSVPPTLEDVYLYYFREMCIRDRPSVPVFPGR